MANGELFPVGPHRLPADVEQLARWWTTATQEARYALLIRAWRKDQGAPPLAQVQLAALIAEAEASEVEKG